MRGPIVYCFEGVDNPGLLQSYHIFEDAKMEISCKRAFYLLYARTSILLGELSKALELVSEATHMSPEENESMYRSQCDFLRATCYMYQGKLEKGTGKNEWKPDVKLKNAVQRKRND